MNTGADNRTLSELLKTVSSRLRSVSETPLLDAQVLLAEVTGKPRSWVLAHPEQRLTAGQYERLQQSVLRLEHGEPLPYILEHWEFFGLDFKITPAVLIPRPETELLVEHALAWLEDHPGRRSAIDVGTGSGCIAIAIAAIAAIAVRNQQVSWAATDISRSALEVARQNAQAHQVHPRIHFVQADLLEGIDGSFDLVCANLPYIPAHALKSLPVFKQEPALALDGGPDGLALIRRLLSQLPGRLAPGGLALLEIEAGQGAAACQAARTAFPHAAIEVFQDLSGKDRLLSIQ